MKPASLSYRNLPGAETEIYRDVIWRFMSRFVQSRRDTFEASLVESERVILGLDLDGEVRALWALDHLSINALGWKRPVLFLRYAYVDPAFRKKARTIEIYLRQALRYWLRHPFRTSYLAFAASSCPAYLMMARNTLEGWPHRAGATPHLARVITRRVGERLRFSGWDPRTSVLRLEGLLRNRAGQAPEGDSDADFYRRKNPGEVHGDALFVLVPMTRGNVYVAARKVLLRYFAGEFPQGVEGRAVV